MSQTSLLMSAWKARNRLYEDLFGPVAYTLPKGNVAPVTPNSQFTRIGGADQQQIDGSNFTVGMSPEPLSGSGNLVYNSEMTSVRITIMAYAPNETRPYWMYVTSGLSNPWFQDEAGDVSGFGCELMVKSNKDGRWPLKLLRRLCQYILSYSGTLSPGVIVNMAAPLTENKPGNLNNIFVWYADEAPDCLYQLPSGVFGMFCTVGITEDECQFAESINEYGCWSIQQVLRQTGVGQITDPNRSSVMNQENIGGILQSVRSYADNFRPT